jgi:SAM-dependent methyltransferase
MLAQSYENWEWLVVLNGSAVWEPPEQDPRIRVHHGQSNRVVGAIKREACALADGDILLELDHDDILAPTCLAEVVAAFEQRPRAVLVYSDFAQLNADGSANFDTFNPKMGWEYAPANIGGLLLNRCLAMEPSPHNVSYIWYAPNHVRAFRRTAYEKAGGYDPALEVLDDQALMMRLYELGDFSRIPKCLYIQRMHPGNTQRDERINRLIQKETVEQYHRGVARLATAWALRARLARIELRTATSPSLSPAAGTVAVEIDPVNPRLPYGDSEVGVIVANELLQRIPDRGPFFAECFRVLAHGGLLLTTTPSTDGRGAFQDPTHVSFWNENSFWYLTQAPLRDHAFPALSHVRFQVSGLRTHYPSRFHESAKISYVEANLLAIKDGSRQGGPLLC